MADHGPFPGRLAVSVAVKKPDRLAVSHTVVNARSQRYSAVFHTTGHVIMA
ncbi:MAG: hypothetical protein Q8R28_02085 [Dehalococcoidia bacterium]|nr:hypothetical protein [Dehalococcoidia bacterium]